MIAFTDRPGPVLRAAMLNFDHLPAAYAVFHLPEFVR